MILMAPLTMPLTFAKASCIRPLILATVLVACTPVGAYPLETFRTHLLHHPTDKGVDIHAFPLHPLGLLRAIMGGDALTIITVDPSQGDRWTHHIRRSIGRQTLRARRHITLRHMGHKPVGILGVAGLHQTRHRVGFQGLSTPLPGIPLPLLVQPRRGQRASMHPLVCLRIPSTAGRNDRQRRVVLAMTPMGLDHDDRAALKGLATHRTKEIVQAFHPTRHERTEPRFGMLIKWCAQDLRHGEDNMPIDDPVMEYLTHLSDPIVDIDLGTSQAQRRLTAHGHALFPLTTMETAVCDRAYLVRIPTPEHLVDKVIVVGRIGARTERFKPLPMLGKDLFKNLECCVLAGDWMDFGLAG